MLSWVEHENLYNLGARQPIHFAIHKMSSLHFNLHPRGFYNRVLRCVLSKQSHLSFWNYILPCGQISASAPCVGAAVSADTTQ